MYTRCSRTTARPPRERVAGLISGWLGHRRSDQERAGPVAPADDLLSLLSAAPSCEAPRDQRREWSAP
eukprot:scaffold388_cov380-Prasinococcus_capsulatus_cf.AAC.46